MSVAEFKHESMQITTLLIASVIAHYADERGIKTNKRKTSMEFALVLPPEFQDRGGCSITAHMVEVQTALIYREKKLINIC